MSSIQSKTKDNMERLLRKLKTTEVVDKQNQNKLNQNKKLNHSHNVIQSKSKSKSLVNLKNQEMKQPKQPFQIQHGNCLDDSLENILLKKQSQINQFKPLRRSEQIKLDAFKSVHSNKLDSDREEKFTSITQGYDKFHKSKLQQIEEQHGVSDITSKKKAPRSKSRKDENTEKNNSFIPERNFNKQNKGINKYQYQDSTNQNAKQIQISKNSKKQAWENINRIDIQLLSPISKSQKSVFSVKPEVQSPLMSTNSMFDINEQKPESLLIVPQSSPDKIYRTNSKNELPLEMNKVNKSRRSREDRRESLLSTHNE